MPKIIAFGEVLWDMLPTGPKVGGAPCNFAFHCSQLGADVTMISAVGNDRLGRELLAYYERLGLSTEQIEVVPDLPTGTVDVEIVAGQPKYTIVENVAWDRITLDSRSLEPAARADAQRGGGVRGEIHKRPVLKQHSLGNACRSLPGATGCRGRPSIRPRWRC